MAEAGEGGETLETSSEGEGGKASSWRERAVAFRSSLFFKTEEELEEFRDLVKNEGNKARRRVGEAVLRLHKVVEFLPLSVIQEELSAIYEIASEGNLPDEDEFYSLAVAVLSTEILKRQERGREVEVSRGTEGDIKSVLEELAKVNEGLLKVESDQLELQKRQIELMRRSGFSGFVSAMEARAGINVQQFDTEVPLWYNECSPEWKRVIRTNLGILLGAYLKFRSPGNGAESIIKSEDIHIERDALAFMWEKMPGFRVAVATMICDLFEEKNGKIIVSQVGKDKLENTDSYLASLVGRMSNYFSKDHQSLSSSYLKSSGPEGIDPDIAARFAVYSAFNLFYLSGAFESGDLGRGLKNPKSFNPSVRAFLLPRDQARSKYVLGEENIVGTDEAWGGPLGEWFAERIRHDPQFKKDFLNKEGVTRIMPERLMYSMFDLTYFSDGKSLSQALLSVLSGQGKKTIDESLGLVDYKDPESVNWRDLDPELWGGYSGLMDSAWIIYKAIIGKADPTKDSNRQALCNALSKLRKDKVLGEIYTGENGEWIVKAVLISLLGGPNMYSTDILLKLDETVYDYAVWSWLQDDRIFAGLPNNAREGIFDFFNARDPDNVILFPSSKRRKLRNLIAQAQAKIRQRSSSS